MKIITTRDVVRQTKAMFELAETEDVIVRRGQKYFQIIEKEQPDAKLVDDKWLDDFFQIPAKYRCNPFDVSPSGDLFFADKRNLEHIEKARTGNTRLLTRDDQRKLFAM